MCIQFCFCSDKGQIAKNFSKKNEKPTTDILTVSLTQTIVTCCALVTTVNNAKSLKEDVLFLVRGTSEHISPSNEVTCQRKVKIGNGQFIKVKGEGSAGLQISNDMVEDCNKFC